MNAWQVIGLFFIGFSLGIFTGAKYIDNNKYVINKMKAKGEDNNVSGNILPAEKEKKKKLRFFKRKSNGS
jgi:hypothetical protein